MHVTETIPITLKYIFSKKYGVLCQKMVDPISGLGFGSAALKADPAKMIQIWIRMRSTLKHHNYQVKINVITDLAESIFLVPFFCRRTQDA
jgi:hypothetical protein